MTSDTTNAVPNPGSDEAILRGCTCPVIDNAHGKGYMGGAKGSDGYTLFVYTCGCPVHAPHPAQERDDAR
jgi:hypothetical protein